jgi:hypothetical protein
MQGTAISITTEDVPLRQYKLTGYHSYSGKPYRLMCTGKQMFQLSDMDFGLGQYTVIFFLS